MSPDSKEGKRRLAEHKAFMRKVASPYVPGPGPCRRVYQRGHGFCARPIWFCTAGLGPCIGLCIAWKWWAGIAHTDWIDMDQCEDIAAVIKRAKKVIPAEVLHSVRPVLCGADIATDGTDPQPRDTAENTLRSRARIVELLREAGFGEPHVWWNQLNETTHLVAHLGQGVIYIDNGYGIVGRWMILQ